jgi:hypothetical protein
MSDARASGTPPPAHVAFAHEGETFGELHPLGGAGHLLAEDALGAGRRQVALLRRQL